MRDPCTPCARLPDLDFPPSPVASRARIAPGSRQMLPFPFAPMKPFRSIPLALLLCLLRPVMAHAQVDINHADAKMLAESLTGIGLVKAEAIVAYRDSHGPFLHIEDLAAVDGIGERTIEANRDAIMIVVESPLPRRGRYPFKGS